VLIVNDSLVAQYVHNEGKYAGDTQKMSNETLIEKPEPPDTGRESLIVAASFLQLTSANLRPTGQKCMNTKEIVQAARSKLGLKVKLTTPLPEELIHCPIPSIVSLKNNVYMVLGRNDERGVLLYDTLRKRSITVAKEEFLLNWSGEVIELTRPFSWAEFGRKFHLEWFIPTLQRYRQLFREVVLTSLFLQICALTIPLITQVIIDKVLPNNGAATLDILVAVLVVSSLLQGGMSFLRTYLMTHTTNKVDVILGSRLFRHIATLPLRYFETRRVGDTLMRVAALTGIRDFLTGTALTSALDILFSLVFVVIMFGYNATLTWISLVAIPIYVLQSVLVAPVVRRRLEVVWATGAESNAFLVEAVNGVHTLKSLAIEPQFNHRWEQLLAKSVSAGFRQATLNIGIGSITGLIQMISSMSILWYGGHLVMNGNMTIGQLVAFQMLSGQANAPLMRLAGIWQSFQQAGMSMLRLGDILGTAPEPVQRSAQHHPSGKLQGGIVFENVVFRYRADGEEVLRKISLTIEPGMRVGIVGRSGSGKSTLTKLAQRLYLPESGRVLIDGLDIAGLQPGWFRQQLGVVLQENYLFSGSVRENISLSRPSAPMEEVIRAAQMAGAHEFILELSEGYDTPVGERGASLSGGQRQRVAIARALMADPRILIFDEATSALDYQSESIIMKNLDQIVADRTLIMIAHRLSTVRRCDIIFVIEQGQVAEQGNHDELMAAKGLYYNLYIQQEV